MKTLVLALALAVSGSAFAADLKKDCSAESNYPEVTKKELSDLVAKKEAFVVDVNSKESYAKSHVPTAIHYGTEESKFAEVLPKDKSALIVAYCGGPQCTAWKQAAKQACELGYTNVRHFKGGITGWNKKS